MRRALILLAFPTLLALVSCSDGEDEPPAAPTTVLIEAEPGFADRALDVASDALAPSGLEAALAAPGEEPHITIGSEAAERGTPFVTRTWVLVTGLSHVLQDEAGNPSVPFDRLNDLNLLVTDDPAPPLEQWGIMPQKNALPIADIFAQIEREPETLALLPLEAVDARVQSVLLDGVSAVFDSPAAPYPLVERMWVSAAEHEDPDFSLEMQLAEVDIAEKLTELYRRPDPIILRATGDIIPARCVYAKHVQYGDFAHAFRALGPWLSQADITVGSLDASISDAGRPFGCEPTFSLLAPAASVEGLALAGFDVITVATNHVKDCGQDTCGDQAFFDTLEILRANGIEPVGGGADLAEARAPAIVDVRGTTFAFLGADQIASYYHAAPGVPGVAPLREDYLREDVAAAAAEADVVVVLPQWGVEYTHDPTASQRSLAAAAIEAGADLVIGNHPHWVQAVGASAGGFVAYALGNFVFDQDWSVATQQGVVLEAAFHGAELKGVRLLPIRIVDEHQPIFAEPAEAQQILENIWDASARLP